MEKESCCSLRENSHCLVFTDGTCEGFESCPFYKSIRQAAQEREAVNDRIMQLPYTQRREIAQKYYGGKLEWEGYSNDG